MPSSIQMRVRFDGAGPQSQFGTTTPSCIMVSGPKDAFPAGFGAGGKREQNLMNEILNPPKPP